MVPIQRVLQEITVTELIRVHIGPCYGLSLTSTPHLCYMYILSGLVPMPWLLAAFGAIPLSSVEVQLAKNESSILSTLIPRKS